MPHSYFGGNRSTRSFAKAMRSRFAVHDASYTTCLAVEGSWQDVALVLAPIRCVRSVATTVERAGSFIEVLGCKVGFIESRVAKGWVRCFD